MIRMSVRAVPERRAAEPQKDRNRQQEPGDEPARMRPVGHPARRQVGGDSAEELQPEPDAKHHPGGDGEDLEEHDEDEQDIDPRLGEEQQVAPHHARDGARGTDRGHRRQRRRDRNRSSGT